MTVFGPDFDRLSSSRLPKAPPRRSLVVDYTLMLFERMEAAPRGSTERFEAAALLDAQIKILTLSQLSAYYAGLSDRRR